MNESLDELKRQRAEIDKKIRSMKPKYIVETENFIIRKASCKRISVNSRIRGYDTCHLIEFCYSNDDAIKTISSLIRQLEHIKEQLNHESAV